MLGTVLMIEGTDAGCRVPGCAIPVLIPILPAKNSSSDGRLHFRLDTGV